MTERFTLLSELGRGGMGVVWKARDEETGQIVALKLLREAYAEDPEYLARFERELELAKRIDSVHVVKVLGFGVRQRVPYLALEYVDGPSLHDALIAHGPYSWAETRALLIQLTQGLADANAAAVIHRDMKPSNVLIGPDGIAKLTDFGIARGLDSARMTATSTMLGTPAYLAPEGPKNARSDLYSLGIIGYQLLTGEVPFKGTTYQDVIIEHMRTPPDLNRLPAEARPTIAWLLAKDPAQRPQRASALLPILYGAAAVPTTSNAPARAIAPIPAAPGPVATPAPTPAPATVQMPGQMPPANHSTTPTAGRPPIAKADLPAASVQPGLTPTQVPGPRRHRSAGLALVLSAIGLCVAIALAAVWISRPGSSFSSIGSMSSGRVGHTATLLASGKVLITGGYDSSSTFASAEMYDPGTGSFSSTESMSSAREYHTATLLANGKVLITGGVDSSDVPMASAELYDPGTGSFSSAGSMSSARKGHTQTLLESGRVLITGGIDSLYAPLASAELYDPATGSFSSTGSMSTARMDHTATLLASGRVLITGGDGPRGPQAAAELYDPGTGSFSSIGSMSSARSNQTATLLASDKVLITGGGGDSGLLASAEIYTP
jgi:serine/threonine protein kinase